MGSKILECSSEKQQKTWSEYVKLSKYFSSTLKRCQSTPCLPIAKEAESSFVPSALPSPAQTGVQRSSPYLSLSWQLACNPVDPIHQQGYSAQRQQAADFPHCRDCRQVDLIALNCDQAKPKKKARKHRDSLQSPGESPKIVVVDAITLRAYWNQRHGDFKREDRIRERSQPVGDSDLENPPQPPKKTVLKIRNPYAVPLCQRPTAILGPQLTAQQDPQQQQQQQQQEQQLQQQQQQQETEYYQAEFQRHRPTHFPHVARLAKEQNVHSPKYAVPLESVYNQLKRGSRYCGNFYYR